VGPDPGLSASARSLGGRSFEKGRVMTNDRYFAKEGGAAAEGQGSIVQWDALDQIEATPGLNFQPILGQNLMVNFVSFEPNTEAPTHWHDEEQISFVIDGEMEFEVGDQKKVVRRGEAIVIPPNVPHAARTYDHTCLEVDVFNPPRRGLLELMGLEGKD
jgi:quercetin dioxygenase-like cupin family protein